ncbi:MAG: hypothetical protein RR998_06740 [Oscillospiraceae bacterium]
MSCGRSKSGVFLLEFVIMLLVFSLASAVCIQLFATARTLELNAAKLDEAEAAATTLSEKLKASDGSEPSLHDCAGENFTAAYDAAWNTCTPSAAVYTARTQLSRESGANGDYLYGVIVVSCGDEKIYELPFGSFYPKGGGEA